MNYLFILSSSIFYSNLFPITDQANECPIGWFGTSCHLKCRCVDNRCDVLGKCTDGSSCLPMWFGPKCQYMDVAQDRTIVRAPFWLTDGRDSTCNPDDGAMQVTLRAAHFNVLPVIWFRLVVNEKDLLEKLAIQINKGTTCHYLRNFKLNAHTADYYCNWKENLTKVTLTGQGVKGLCSLYLSKGRNVALKHPVSQTSTFSVQHEAKNAVDGQSQGNCTLTNPLIDQQATWFLNSTIPLLVSSINLVTGLAQQQELLLTAYNRHGGELFSLKRLFFPQTTYSIITHSDHFLYSLAISPLGELKQLSICKVQLWGEKICPEGMWGLECEQACRCQKVAEMSSRPAYEVCSPSNGICGGPCPLGTYGLFCSMSCSDNCNGPCFPDSGKCLSCKDGYVGPFCEQVCDSSFYGPKCSQKCPIHCENNLCDHVSGDCQGCEMGYFKSPCTSECQPPAYSFNCSERCSELCATCENSTEKCTSCPTFFLMPDCTEQQKENAVRVSEALGVPSFSLGVGMSVLFFSIVGAFLVVLAINRETTNEDTARASNPFEDYRLETRSSDVVIGVTTDAITDPLTSQSR